MGEMELNRGRLARGLRAFTGDFLLAKKLRPAFARSVALRVLLGRPDRKSLRASASSQPSSFHLWVFQFGVSLSLGAWSCCHAPHVVCTFSVELLDA